MSNSSAFKLGYAVGHADAFWEGIKKERELLDEIRELTNKLEKYRKAFETEVRVCNARTKILDDLKRQIREQNSPNHYHDY